MEVTFFAQKYRWLKFLRSRNVHESRELILAKLCAKDICSFYKKELCAAFKSS